MATKTISIELDVYERLKSLKKDSLESFSQVIRRAHWGEERSTAANIFEWMNTRKVQKKFLLKDTLDRLDVAQENDTKPQNKWR